MGQLKDKSRHKIGLRIRLQNASEFKRQTFYALEDIPKANLPGKIIGIGLLLLIILNAVLVFISAQPGIDPLANDVVQSIFFASTICFCAEYIARIWIADLAYDDISPARARLRYVFSVLGIIDFLSFFPNMIAWFLTMSNALREFVNVVRLVRLVKISRYMRGLRTIARVLTKYRSEIVASFLVILLLIVLSSVVMYEIENPAQPEQFNSLLSGLYWAVTTITATGYGDIVPITPLGRIVGAVIMLLSLALIAIPGGIFSAGFVAEFQNAGNRRILRTLKKEAKQRNSASGGTTGSVSGGASGGPSSGNGEAQKADSQNGESGADG